MSGSVKTSPRATAAARLPAIVIPADASLGVRKALQALKEHAEARQGARGNPFERTVTARDLATLDQQRVTITAGGGRGGAGGIVTVGPDGRYTITTVQGMAQQFAAQLYQTKLYKDLTAKIDDPARFDAFGERVRAQLLPELNAIAAQRGADIQRAETRLQSAQESFAALTTEVTAAVAGNTAAVRQTLFAYADQNKATAGAVTTITARLDDFDGGGATVETVASALADRATGLEAKYTVKVNANGTWAGIGLAATSNVAGNATSAVIIAAQTFALLDSSETIADPLNPPVARVPFGVDLVNNVLYLNGQVRINAGGTAIQDIANLTFIGSYASAPSTTGLKKNNVYANTTDGNSYILDADGGAWVLFVEKGDTGTPGVDGTDGVNGEDGIFREFVWKRAASIPSTPTGNGIPSGWSDDPPAGSDPLWMSVAKQELDGTLVSGESWATPIRHDGPAGADGADGTDGADGARGSITLYASGSSWSDATANSTISSVTGSATKIIGDTVTISNGSSFAATKYWSGSAWVNPGVVIDGNLLVSGTVSASVINGGSMSATLISGGTLSASTVNLGSGTFQVNGTTGYMSASNAFISVAGFGNLWDPSQPCITATAFSSTTALAAIFTNPSSDSNAHGLRGRNTHYGTSGLVGVANATHAFYAESGTYGPFTGSHDGALAIGSEIEPGDIVVDLRCIGRRGYSDTIFEVARSSSAGQRGCAGVFVSNAGLLGDNQPSAMVLGSMETPTGPMPIMSAEFYELADTHDYVIYNAVGEGQINVCGQGGDLQPDDLIVASDMPGKGMRQADNVVRGNTVARVREAVTFSSPGEWRAVACTYLSR